MGKVTREEALTKLRAANPKASPQTLTLYVDAFLDFQEAEANIRAHGVIVAHPRTGAPIENPYLRTKAAAVRALQRFRLRTECLWPEPA